MKIVVALSKAELNKIGGNKDQLQSYIWTQIEAKPANQTVKLNLQVIDYDVEVVLKD